MRYFVKLTEPSKKGKYIQIYRTNYVPGKGNQNKSYKALGYVEDLKKQGIEDPIKYAKQLVIELNEKEENAKITQVGDVSICKNLGYFLIKGMFDYLDVDYIMDIFTQNKKFKFKMSDFVRTMVYAQIVNPGSKLKAFENVIPNIYGVAQYSYDQILDAIEFIGEDYQKYIELFNDKINKKWKRNMNVNYFDCTNYYFEIDLEDSYRKKGPSKEERHLPLRGQALLLDGEQIPLAMMMYPGNKSEKPYLRQIIEETKERFDINGKTIQVADKGLNCARNIYASSVEANDGYIFSKSVHGKNLSTIEKAWVLLEDDNQNHWNTVYDQNGRLLYKYKECIDTFEYSFNDEYGKKNSFKVKEKRVVTYNPSLARKHKEEIRKEIEKAKAFISIKEAYRDDLGDAAKYLNFSAFTKDGEVAQISSFLKQEKIDEDLAFAGYNLLVTSETHLDAKKIYEIYHGLWRIEESFKIMKSYLEARPVFLQKEASIDGHFTICYIALTLMRLLELKIFKEQLSVFELIKFIRNYNITDTGSNIFYNNANNSKTLSIIKKELGLAKIGNLILRNKDIKNILDVEF